MPAPTFRPWRVLFSSPWLSLTPFPIAPSLPLDAQTVGTWAFKVGSNTHDDSLTCGHKLPDSVMTMVDQKVRPSPVLLLCLWLSAEEARVPLPHTQGWGVWGEEGVPQR